MSTALATSAPTVPTAVVFDEVGPARLSFPTRTMIVRACQECGRALPANPPFSQVCATSISTNSTCPCPPRYNLGVQVERPGTVAAGAVSALVVIAILILSTGSIIRSNQGIRSGTPGDNAGASGAGSGGIPASVSSFTGRRAWSI